MNLKTDSKTLNHKLLKLKYSSSIINNKNEGTKINMDG